MFWFNSKKLVVPETREVSLTLSVHALQKWFPPKLKFWLESQPCFFMCYTVIVCCYFIWLVNASYLRLCRVILYKKKNLIVSWLDLQKEVKWFQMEARACLYIWTTFRTKVVLLIRLKSSIFLQGLSRKTLTATRNTFHFYLRDDRILQGHLMIKISDYISFAFILYVEIH